jgi:hypothetical protein
MRAMLRGMRERTSSELPLRVACAAGAMMDGIYLIFWQRFVAWSRENGHGAPAGPRFSRTSLNRPNSHTYPELSSQYKAAVVKLLVAWVAHESARIDPDPLRRLHAYALAQWQSGLSLAGIWLAREEQRRSHDLGRMYLLSHARLAKLHMATDPQHFPAALWFVRPKHHSFDHMARLVKNACRCASRKPPAAHRPQSHSEHVFHCGDPPGQGPQSPRVCTPTPLMHLVAAECSGPRRSGTTSCGRPTPCTFSARGPSPPWAGRTREAKTQTYFVPGAAPGSWRQGRLSACGGGCACIACMAEPTQARMPCCRMLPGEATPDCACVPAYACLQVKRVATHCHGATVLFRVLQRIMLHYALRWRRRQQEGRLCV